MTTKIEYVKLIYYIDKKNNDKSWGEIHYKLITGDKKQIERTYKEKITKKEYPLCLKAFKKQEGSDYLPYEKYQLYDAKTKKPLNMPYYLQPQPKIDVIKDQIKDRVDQAGEVIGKHIKELNNMKKAIDRETKPKKNVKKMMIRLTSIATVSTLLAVIGSYELKKQRIYWGNTVYVHHMSNDYDALDSYLSVEYLRFEGIIKKLASHDYENISEDDIRFFNKYVYNISLASNNNQNNRGRFYIFDYYQFLEKDSFDQDFFIRTGGQYDYILDNDMYRSSKAYEYCARGCNVLFYNISTVSQNRCNYSPTKEEVTSFSMMSNLSKLVFLNELRGAIIATNFNYKTVDEPYWWISFGKDKTKLLDRIDNMIQNCTDNLIYEVNEAKRMK